MGIKINKGISMVNFYAFPENITSLRPPCRVGRSKYMKTAFMSSTYSKFNHAPKNLE